MRLLRLKLDNWRGVESRDVEFTAGVTLIEGPNEIGKSTIVEAIQNIFTVMDSSSRADIKAIQPVGQDVGSSVEVEAEVGGCHFVYAKTYNKNKQTELRVLAPQAEQLTGREAHERVGQILEASVDMALWNALLVEQGNEIAGVTLSQSDGLARALDAAAGSELPEPDDSDLFARVQAEYDQYFTKTGKPRYTALESEVNDAQAVVDTANAALVEVESDSDNHERCLAEIRRFDTALPELRKEEREHEANWQAIGKIRAQVTLKQGELEAAQALLKAAGDEMVRRRNLVKSVDEGAQALKDAREQLTPRVEQLATLKASADAAHAALNTAKATLKQARTAADLARVDDQHLKNTAALGSANKKLTQLQIYSASLAAARQALQGIKTDADALEALRGSERELQMALARLGTATSSIEIAAQDNLRLTLNDEALALSDGAVERRDIASDLRVSIAGVVSIRVTPSRSANELEAEADERRQVLAQLLAKYAVKDLADAVAVETKRASDEREAESWSGKIDELLGADTAADLQAYADDLDVRCKDYLAQRGLEPALPESLDEAATEMAVAGETLTECEREVDAQQTAWEALRDKHTDASAQYSVVEQEINGHEKFVNLRQQELAQSRANEADEAIELQVAGKSAVVDALQGELAALYEQLESASPVAAEALFTNAQAARQRAANDLAAQQTQLAILQDRLTKAQADGRFEALEAAEHKLVALQAQCNATLARAGSARRLWQVLSNHRDAARKAYVRPLKEGVEQLGKIVFGADFAIELGDDWGLMSRTQDGKTIPFDDLSVGAKEQLGILMRLAAARIVSSQGGVPLIIDDALGFSDPSRLKTMGAAIASAGNDCQIILLTCTPGRFTHVGSAAVVRF